MQSNRRAQTERGKTAMGEARRRTLAGLMPDKTETGSARKNWADILRPEQIEKGRKDREHILNSNLVDIRGHYREAVAQGMPKPLVLVGDARDEYVAELVKHADDRGKEILNDYADAGMIPTIILALPSDEAANALGHTSPNGKRNAERIVELAARNGAIPVVCMAAHGNLFGLVPDA